MNDADSRVSPEVDAKGSTIMEAHLKIAEGGGPLAPRIYFMTTPPVRRAKYM